MKEDFVTIEIAKKLKEKEFDWETIEVYERNIIACQYEDYPKPSISQVLKWLREEKNLHIEIWWNTQYTAKNLKGFQFVVTPICEKPQRETDLELYCDYETAAIKGVEYVIDNLI